MAEFQLQKIQPEFSGKKFSLLFVTESVPYDDGFTETQHVGEAMYECSHGCHSAEQHSQSVV